MTSQLSTLSVQSGEFVSELTNNDVSSIASSAMLVELSISQWTGRKKDKRASSDVTSRNYADNGVASVNKKLMGKWEKLDALHKLTGSIRNAHYSMTMPWSDTGLRLLPTAQYFKYHQTMTDIENEFHRLVQLFLDAYDWEIVQAEAKLGWWCVCSGVLSGVGGGGAARKTLVTDSTVRWYLEHRRGSGTKHNIFPPNCAI